MITKFIKSVGYALNGIKIGIKNERNVRIDIVVGSYVLYFSTFYDFSKTDYLITIILFFGMLAFELMNTAVERAVDKPDDAHYMQAGEAKDTAAGGVLLFAIGAAAIGLVLFWDIDVFKSIIGYYINNIPALIALLISFVVSYRFIYNCFGLTDKK